MFPDGPGGMAYFEYNYQDQDRNWHASSRAPSANNDDKEIRTHIYIAGLRYMFDDAWGAQIEVPYDSRMFKVADGTGSAASLDWNQLGDIRLTGLYTGFSQDQASGLEFGLKLPTGSYRHKETGGDIDRDTQIGTGSTDLLLGGYHHAGFASDERWNWFAQAQLDVPLLIQDEYRPGTELDAAIGSYFGGFSLGRVKITPVAQIIASERTRDTGANSADPVASGYQRILLSPGVEFRLHPFSLYADIEIPTYEHVTGNQLVAPVLVKAVASYMF